MQYLNQYFLFGLQDFNGRFRLHQYPIRN